MKLTWYGHACFKLETAEGSVVFDPYSPGSVPGLTLPALEADAVICSHGHGDHNYAAGVRLTGRAPGFAVRQLPCFHDDVQGQKCGNNLITSIDAEGLRFVHMGDIGHMLTHEQLDWFGRVDVLMIPIGGYYTIDAAQAHELAAAIGAGITIPMHYRGPGFGYAEIATRDGYAALCAHAEYIDAGYIELPCDFSGGTTLFFNAPEA